MHIIWVAVFQLCIVLSTESPASRPSITARAMVMAPPWYAWIGDTRSDSWSDQGKPERRKEGTLKRDLWPDGSRRSDICMKQNSGLPFTHDRCAKLSSNSVVSGGSPFFKIDLAVLSSTPWPSGESPIVQYHQNGRLDDRRWHGNSWLVPTEISWKGSCSLVVTIHKVNWQSR